MKEKPVFRLRREVRNDEICVQVTKGEKPNTFVLLVRDESETAAVLLHRADFETLIEAMTEEFSE